MAESRAKRMQVVLTLAVRQEDEAAKKLSQFREQLAQEEMQLADLREYATQYLHAQGELREGVLAHELINYSTFINRLNEACREQEAKVQRYKAILESLQQQWRVKHQKRKSIEDLITRLQQEDNLLLDKRLQKEMDELSSQQLRRQSDNGQ
ncbi:MULTISPECIES: flagellar export protein FliJ [Cellvibrio]|jgi:flagellar FliJ protein|uniref:Flagellar FliJ protein n=1 Tax=Cellvibrio fibrivorans TaxID=126350 RepID=A0ABU1UWJ0_9GAMM|nr:flagellar export protein FliJ [Cellvibrio fibrivorans]MDR7089497.1 flagellar FliJ protein [Cellvibrio fibrivorans]